MDQRCSWTHPSCVGLRFFSFNWWGIKSSILSQISISINLHNHCCKGGRQAPPSATKLDQRFLALHRGIYPASSLLKTFTLPLRLFAFGCSWRMKLLLCFLVGITTAHAQAAERGRRDGTEYHLVLDIRNATSWNAGMVPFFLFFLPFSLPFFSIEHTTAFGTCWWQCAL